MKKILMYASALVLAVALTSCGRDEAPKGKKEKVEEPSKGGETPKKGDETPGTGTPGGENPGSGTPGTGNPGGGTPDNGKPGDGAPDNGKPGDGTPDNENPEDGAPEEGIVSADGKYTLSKDKMKLIKWNDEDATDVNLTTNEDLKNVKVIGAGAFSDSSDLKSITLPNGLQRIENTAFMDTSLTTVVLPETLTHIGANAFNNAKITDLRIPNSVTHIGANAFLGNQLATLEIGTGITVIGETAFATNNLTSVKINATTPPQVSNDSFRQRSHALKIDIFVPASSVSAYQKAWTAYAGQIKPQN